MPLCHTWQFATGYGLQSLLRSASSSEVAQLPSKISLSLLVSCAAGTAAHRQCCSLGACLPVVGQPAARPRSSWRGRVRSSPCGSAS